MNKNTSIWIQKHCHGKEVRLSKGLRKLDLLQEKMISNLSVIKSLHFIKVKPNAILISSEADGFHKNPITRPGHPSAIGIWIELDYSFKILEFVEINWVQFLWNDKFIKQRCLNLCHIFAAWIAVYETSNSLQNPRLN